MKLKLVFLTVPSDIIQVTWKPFFRFFFLSGKFRPKTFKHEKYLEWLLIWCCQCCILYSTMAEHSTKRRARCLNIFTTLCVFLMTDEKHWQSNIITKKISSHHYYLSNTNLPWAMLNTNRSNALTLNCQFSWIVLVTEEEKVSLNLLNMSILKWSKSDNNYILSKREEKNC